MNHQKLEVYPNPANSILKVNIPEGNSSAQIEILDNVGKKFFQMNSLQNQQEIDIKHLERGVYTISLLKDNQYFYQKFIKE